MAGKTSGVLWDNCTYYSSEASSEHSETYLVSLGHNFDFEGTNIGLVKVVM